VSYAIVDIDKWAETSVNVQVQFLLLLPKSHFTENKLFKSWIAVITTKYLESYIMFTWSWQYLLKRYCVLSLRRVESKSIY